MFPHDEPRSLRREAPKPRPGEQSIFGEIASPGEGREKKKTPEVHKKRLSPEEQMEFDLSDEREWASVLIERMAVKILSQPVDQSVSERAHKDYMAVKTADRNRLGSKPCEDLPVMVLDFRAVLVAFLDK